LIKKRLGKIRKQKSDGTLRDSRSSRSPSKKKETLKKRTPTKFANLSKRTSIGWELLPVNIGELSQTQLLELRAEITKRYSNHLALAAARLVISKQLYSIKRRAKQGKMTTQKSKTVSTVSLQRESAQVCTEAQTSKRVTRKSIGWQLMPSGFHKLDEEQLVDLQKDIIRHHSNHPALGPARDMIIKRLKKLRQQKAADLREEPSTASTQAVTKDTAQAPRNTQRTSLQKNLLPAKFDDLTEPQLVKLRQNIKRRNRDHPELQVALDLIAKQLIKMRKRTPKAIQPADKQVSERTQRFQARMLVRQTTELKRKPA